MSGGDAPAPDYTASNELAAITEQGWANFSSNFQPVEDQQDAFATNPNLPLQAAQRAGINADAASTSAAQGLNKKLGSEGITLTPEQKTALAERQGNAAGLSKVNDMNKAAIGTYDTQSRVLSGASPSVTSITSPQIGQV